MREKKKSVLKMANPAGSITRILHSSCAAQPSDDSVYSRGPNPDYTARLSTYRAQVYIRTIDFRSSFSLSLSLYAHCFWPTSGILRKLKFCFASYFGITRRNIRNKHFYYLYFLREKTDFREFFLIFTASVQSWNPEPTLVTEVLIASSHRNKGTQ